MARLDPMGRQVKVQKSELIEKIKENKAAHIKEYEEAVGAFKEKATGEIKKLESELTEGTKKVHEELGSYLEKVEQGALEVTFNIPVPQVNLNLVIPEDRREDYDKLITMFEMEVDDVVILSQGEFNQYIHDEFQWAIAAKLSNSAYLAKG